MLVRSGVTAHETNSFAAKLSVSSTELLQHTGQAIRGSQSTEGQLAECCSATEVDVCFGNRTEESFTSEVARSEEPVCWQLIPRNYIATHHNMKVFGVNRIGLLLFIAYIAILLLYYEAYTGNVVRDLGVSTTECSSPFLDGCFNGVGIEDKINNPSWPMPTSSEGIKNDPILEPKHKIFLSHSGAQKEFVEHLCKAFEDRFYYPFFDRRHESLPKGERFLELIVQAAEQCEMLIVVVSEEYFMSKWPMIELTAFVKAHKLHHES